MINILQGNLHRSRTANDLLRQLILEKKSDILIISEQYQDEDSPTWYKDTLGTAAIWVLNPTKVPIMASGSEDGCVWVKSEKLTLVSCYFTPNEPIADFQAKLDTLEDVIQNTEGRVVVAGDFNARALEWGMPHLDSRGKRIMEMVSRQGLIVLNKGTTSTFRRPGYRETIPDITFATEDAARRVTGWGVIEDFTGSDHQYIEFQVGDLQSSRDGCVTKPSGWNAARLNVERFEATLDNGKEAIAMKVRGLPVDSCAEDVVKDTMNLIHKASDASMPRKKHFRGRKATYWWSTEIAELRKKSFQSRRKAQRARKRIHGEFALKTQEYLCAKKELRKAIRSSKVHNWKTLQKEVDNNPWGLGYKIVTQKLRRMSPMVQKDAVTMEHIVNALFPTHLMRVENPRDNICHEIPLFSEVELMKAVGSLQTKKAPGPDGVPAEALKVAAKASPKLLLDMYNSCLQEGIFPKRWKVQRLALISKGKGDPSSPSAYRPLCMLDAAGKLLEKLIKPRLQSAVQEAGDLSNRQFGFRKGRSTVDAIQMVVKAVEAAQRGNHHSRKLILLVTLDVKNAFNSAKWDDMLRALAEDFSVPKYLLRMIGAYLKDRILVYGTEDGPRTKEVTAGAAQGSVLGPELWNIAYDGVLRMDMPVDTSLVGYADDVAAIIASRDLEGAQMKLNQVMRRVSQWMVDHGLSLAVQKTEIVVLTTRRMDTIVPIQVGNETI